MLKHLRIKNFKGWADTGAIRMAPITLLFGANSSGKSSIGQFLMMLKQTTEYSDRKAVFFPGDKNSAVQLGSFKEMVHQRNPDNAISFEYQWELIKPFVNEDPISKITFLGKEIFFSAVVTTNDLYKTYLKNFNYKLFHDQEEELTIGMMKKNSHDDEYKINFKNYDLIERIEKLNLITKPMRFYGFPEEVVALYKNADFVQDLNLLHEKFFRSICYLGPMRTKTERLYSWSGSEPESVGYVGDNTIAAILAAKNRTVSIVNDLLPFEFVIAHTLLKMNLIEDFKIAAIAKEREEYEVKLRTKGSNDWVDLPDVGFGISQVLPVLVQCYYAQANSIIILEQPEIHLHPSAQAVLADVMIDVIFSRENEQDRNIQLIIETHSEHFLRRLQRRIAENKITQEKVAAYFCNQKKSGAVLDPLEIDEYGNIRNWPENFFGDEMGDIVGLAEAAMKKRMVQHAGKSA